MAALTIDNLDDNTRAKLRVLAERHGRTVEAEIRAILTDAVAETGVPDAAPAATFTSAYPTTTPEGEPLTWDNVDSETLDQIIHGGPPDEDFVAALGRVFGLLGDADFDVPERTEMPTPLDLDE